MAHFCHKAGALSVHLVEAGMANYVYVVQWGDGCLVVDPAEAAPVRAVLAERDCSPAAYLLTHHHADHVAGVPELTHSFPGEVIGPRGAGIRGLDREVTESDEVAVGPLRFQVLETPGHTATDISYFEPTAGLLFCGDTMFSGGCGRLFECGPEVMWRSLRRLQSLPGPTWVFCGHEYTEENLRFAASMMPDDSRIAAARRRVRELRASGRPSLPSTIGAEQDINLFLRAGEPDVQRAVGMANATAEQVFAELRGRKDRF